MSKQNAIAARRDKIIQEVFDSEHVYRFGLQTFRGVLSDPLIRKVNDKEIILENPEILDLMKCIPIVENTSDEFAALLHKFMNSPPDQRNIADCFQSFIPLITQCFQYIQTYHIAAPLIRSERLTNKALNNHFERFEAYAKDTADAFLITPIQRPPRYRLLITELIKTTDVDSPEYNKLQESLKVISDAIRNLDNKIDEFEEAIQMMEIQNKIPGFEVLVLGRRLYFEGPVTKFSRKWTNQRYIVLFSDSLLVAESHMVVSLKVNKLYKSGEYMIVPVSDSPPFINAVDIRQKDKSFRINMESAEAKKRLLSAFEIVKQVNKIDNAQLELKGFAPVWVCDSHAPNCMECHKPFTTIKRRRHHCRSCGNCVCADCWSNKLVLYGRGDTPLNVCDSCFIRLTRIYDIMQGNSPFEKNDSPEPTESA